MRFFPAPLGALILCVCTILAHSQQISGPEPQAASLTGSVTDVDEATIPGAVIVIDGVTPDDHHVVIADSAGDFTVSRLRPAIELRIKVSAKGFAPWASTVTLTPGQTLDLSEVKLKIAEVNTEVDALSPEQIAIEQVDAESKQRLFGIIPNFYVVYDHQFEPMSTKLKYKLAFKATTDIETFVAAMFLAGIDQAGDRPNYVQGAKGYGQRVGAEYANAATGVMLGGAVLPSLLHQDPRYFYQGTGTKKSRALHAISAPFICKGDNGKPEFNFSAIGGDLASGALSNIYYPPSNRGAGLTFTSAAIASGGRMLNTLAQEFLLSKYTSHAAP